jgi:hypothetical protein
MSTNIRIRVMIGLTVIGSIGWATVREHADADEPRGNSPAEAVAPAAAERYLLLIDGRIVKGVITEDETEFHVDQSVGVMRFRKQKVDGVFNSLHDAYLHRVEQLPERDSEERIKLARWCLNNHLKPEAKEQLQCVLELNSKHPQARAMMFSMNQAAAIVAQRQRDPEVKQTSVQKMPESRPGALDSAVIAGAQRGLNILGMPVIFDLPTPLAIKRSNEFFRFVHPVLQHYCVKCHDGHFEGEFQLVPIASRADRTPEALRANLDATLRLIDQENPSKSELLTSTLRPHGRGARPRSIFPGSNDLTYQILATWAQSLRSPKNAANAAKTQAGQTGTENNDDFAVGRDRIAGELSEGMSAAIANGGRLPHLAPGVAPGSLIPQPTPLGPEGTPGPTSRNQAAPDDFPLPFVLTGKMPALPGATTAPVSGAKSARTGAEAARVSAGAVAGGTGPPVDGTKIGEQAKAGSEPGAVKKKAKPVTIDPTLLERALQNRNSPR